MSICIKILVKLIAYSIILYNLPRILYINYLAPPLVIDLPITDVSTTMTSSEKIVSVWVQGVEYKLYIGDV